MIKKVKYRLIAMSTFGVFLLVAWATGSLLELTGRNLWILRAGLAFLGLLAAGVLLAILRRRAPGRASAAETPEEPGRLDRIRELFAEARTRLQAAPAIENPRIGKLPAVLVLGPAASTKTSVILNSGLDPELLAGQVRHDDAVVPTDPATVWLGGDAVIVEAGGGLLDDPDAWDRIAHHLTPDRWAAVFSRGAQAPRAAVVCFACDEFLKPGASEGVPAAARKIRGRLTELVATLGVRVPVYVLFTKADRLPYFDDFVRSLSETEAREGLGATLPFGEKGGGTSAERESRRVTDAFDGIFRALARRRPSQIRREADEQIRAGAYEFPREFDKISELVTRFLVEVCRPSRLGASPVLRGFYFTGVRAVVVSDPVAAVAAPSAGAREDAPAGATAVFDPSRVRAAAAQAAPSGRTRRVPQWTFLGRILPDVVLRDEAARRLTAGGAAVNLLRRILLGAATAALVVASVGMVVSYFNNRALANDVREALTGVEGMGPTMGAPAAIEDLRRLEDLRVQTERLTRYERAGAPWWPLGWGLYRGDDLVDPVRAAYFDRFRKLLWDDAYANLLATLRGLPPVPDASGEYGRTYSDLRAYLVMTRYPDSASVESLPPTLLRHLFLAGEDVDEERSRLVGAQLAFYAEELPRANPFDVSADATLVAGTRSYLGEFTDSSAFYEAMLRQASRDAEPVDWRQGDVVRSPVVVPPAFTRRGWDRVHDNLEDVDALFARERWVTGEQTPAAADLAKLADGLEQRYVSDYVATWEDFLQQASVAGYGGLPDAAAKLRRLAGNRSPLLELLGTVAVQTSVDDERVRTHFQPVRQVAPVDTTSPASGEYLRALSGLESAVSQAATLRGPERDMAVRQASSAVQEATMAVASVSRGFSGEPQSDGAARSVESLLRAPIVGAQRALGNVEVGERNERGRSFCSQFQGLASRYPFDPAGPPARMDDVATVFQPGTGALWRLYDDALSDLIGLQGNQYAALGGADPAPRPEFVRFFNQAATVSQALFLPDGTGPVVEFRPVANATPEIPEITVSVGGMSVTFTQTQRGSRSLRWNGREAGAARIRGRVGGEDVTLVEAPAGPWALFRLFDGASWTRTGDRRYRVTWHPVVGGRELTLILDLLFNVDAPVFQSRWLGELSCVPRIVG